MTGLKKDSKKDTKEYYDKTQIDYNLFWMNKINLAMHYGFWDDNTKNLHEALLNENKVLAEELEVDSKSNVLDAGCGVGGTAIWIAENYGSKVTGITIVAKQIEQATNNAKKRKVDHLVDFKEMDFCDTDFTDGSFDKIYAIESMCHAQDKNDFIKEIYRMLKPGGVMVIADAFIESAEMSEKNKTQYSHWLEGWALPNLPVLKNFHDDLIKAGFTNIKDTNTNKLIQKSAKRIYRIGKVFYPFDKTCNKLGLVSDTTFKSTVAMLAQYRLFSEGAMQYHLIKAEKGR
jgi:tocopherol O-methyltransferase